MPNAEECTKFWGNIWGVKKEHNREAEWLKECMEMFAIAKNLRTLLQNSMHQWRLSLAASSEDLGEVNVKKGIFQADSLSPLLFVLSMVPLSLILKKVNACYKWGKKEYK